MACIFYALVCVSVIYLKIAITGLGYLLYTYTHRLLIQGTLTVIVTTAGSELQILRLHIIM